MVDPGSAIGIVSLGLQVAQGLVKYYSNYKTYDDDILHAVQRIERLHGTLAALDVPLRKLGTNTDPVPKRVRTSICSCKHELLKLDDVVKKCAEVPASQSMARMKMIEKRLAYPLRKGTLRDVSAWVDRAQEDLDTAMQALHLEVILDFRDGAANDAASIDNQLADIQRRQLDGMDICNSHHNATYAYMQQSSIVATHIDRNVEDVLKRQQQVEHQLSTLMQITTAITDQKRITPNSLIEGHAITQSLHSLAVSADLQTRSGHIRTPHYQALKKNAIRCTCSAFSPTTSLSFTRSRLSFFWQRHPTHKFPCPMSHASQRSDIVGTRVRYGQSMFAYIVEATINYTRSANMYSISPGLKLRRVVTWDNPARRVIHDCYWQHYGNEHSLVCHCIEQMKRRLDQCFRNGTASPTDVDEFGITLLDEFCRILPGLLDSPTSVEQALDLLKFLIDAGLLVDVAVSGNVVCLQPLDDLLYYGLYQMSNKRQNILHICSYLVDQGCTWSPEAIPMTRRYLITRWPMREILSVHTIMQGYDGDPMLTAILYQSAAKLRDLLTKADHSSWFFPHGNGIYKFEKYLNTSSDWPDGLRILLPYLRHHETFEWSTLYWAYEYENWESVELLLEQGFQIGIPEFSWGIFRSSAVMRHMLKVLSQEISPTNSFPKQKNFQHNYVFHVTLTLEAADALHCAGYHMVDNELVERNPSPYSFRVATTPLWKHAERVISYLTVDLSLARFPSFFKVARWLSGKEVRINWVHPRLYTTPAHLLAASPLLLYSLEIWLRQQKNKSIKYDYKHLLSFSEQFFKSSSWWVFCIRVLTAAGRDSCHCACSKNGCLPITCAFKFSAYRNYWQGLFSFDVGGSYQQVTEESIDRTLYWMDTLLSTSLDMANAVARVLTFEKLEIRHTCHEEALYRITYDRGLDNAGPPPFPREDAEEMHEEDAELIAKLEVLTAEFETAYANSSNPSFYDFYKTHWTTRMKEVIAEMSIVTAEYTNAVQEAGVILSPFGPELPPNFTRITEIK